MSARTTTERTLVAMAMTVWLCATGVMACSGGGTSDAGGDTTATDGGADDGAQDRDGRDVGPADAGDAAPDGNATAGDAADADEGVSADSSTADASLDAPVEAGPPSLVALAVSAAGAADASAIALFPAFSSDVHDYAVRCAAGSNVLTVSMTASTGSESLLVQPIASPTLPAQTLSVGVAEGQAVVAAATNGAATVEYWVRCLPHDFPQLAWTPHPQAGAPSPGYYLVGTALPTTSGCYAMVLDGNGVPVWYTPSQATSGWCVFDVDTVVPGAISFDALSDTPTQFELHDLSPLTTTRIAPKGLNTDLHELRVMPDGNYLVISTPLQQGVDVTGMQIPLADGGVETLSGPQTIMACNLVELQPDGTVVWTWSATDHFDAVADSVAPERAPYGPAGTTLVIDPFHCNSVDVDPTSGNLLVSAREMASVFEVERPTGRVIWKMGGATASKDGATYVSVADPFALQHDARFQPDWSSTCNGGSGHISLFDDEVAGAPAPARAVVFDVVVGPGAPDAGASSEAGTADSGPACGDAGPASGSAVVSWQRAGTGPSRAMGSFRILADGSRVIGWGLVPGQGFTEVDVAGNDLVDLTFADGNTTYRAIKVPTSALDLGLLRSTAGLP